MSLLPMVITLKWYGLWVMGYGLWVMGYGYKIPTYQHGKSKNIWVMREYGLSRVWVMRESTT